jgi:mono/diheme cytochrome c family protein
MKMKWRFAKAAMCLVVIVAALVMPAAAQNRRGRNRPLVDLPRGAVRQVILDHCTACHGIDDYAYYALDRAGWQKLIETMKEKGAVISDDDRSILLDWLVTKFGPDSKPFPRARAEGPLLNFGGGDVAARDAAAKRLLDSVCRTCHTLERIEVAQNTEERWRDIVADMKTKGAQIDDADVAPLATYLAKTYGAR